MIQRVGICASKSLGALTEREAVQCVKFHLCVRKQVLCHFLSPAVKAQLSGYLHPEDNEGAGAFGPKEANGPIFRILEEMRHRAFAVQVRLASAATGDWHVI